MESHFHQDALIFLKDLFEQCQSSEVNIPSHWDIDHLCYRVESDDSYERRKVQMAQIGRLCVESLVAGRMISTFVLNKPIEYKQWKISLIELPAPKPGKAVEEGFEHIEIVCDLPFESVLDMFPKAVFNLKKNPKNFNAELEMNFKKGNIKFHHLSLLSVIELEKHEKAWCALQDLKIFETYGPYHLLIGGNIPLGFANCLPQIELHLCASDPAVATDLQNKLIEDFAEFESFDINVDAFHHIQCHFFYKNTYFSISIQSCPTVRQIAYLTFLAKEKIIKYSSAKKPIFLDVPTLLRLQTLSIMELRALTDSNKL